MDSNTEIRKLAPSHIRELAKSLDYGDSWKRIMSIIPKTLYKECYECNLSVNNLPKYSSEHFKLIENASVKLRRSCTEILFDEWGTSGRVRPSLGHLLHLLIKAELFQAADYVAVTLLHKESPERPKNGPAAKVTIILPPKNEEKPNVDFKQRVRQETTIKQNLSNNYEVKKPINKAIIPRLVVTDCSDDKRVNNFHQQIVGPKSNSNNVSASDMIRFSTEESISDMIHFSQSDSFGNVPNITELLDQSVHSESDFTSSDDAIITSNGSAIDTSNGSTVDTSNGSASNTSNGYAVEDENIPNISALNCNNSENIPNLSIMLSKTCSSNENVSDNIPNLSIINGSNTSLPNLSIINGGNTTNYLTNDLLPCIHINSDKEHSNTSFNEQMELENISSVPGSYSRTNCHSPLPNLSLNTFLPHFSYSQIVVATNNFDETPHITALDVNETSKQGNGRFLGSGAFGSVYLAIGLCENLIAVKKLHLHDVTVVNIDDTVTKQFKNEVEVLSKYNHENLLSLIGYSCDGPTYCLLYEYISGGALKDILQNNKELLTWKDRLAIILGTAKAVAYLHTAFDIPLIHRDIKSANILLDCTRKPKLCDFGLIKPTPNQNTITGTSVFGTSAYMAPEAFRGDISVKLDTFSFGVVILELLTGLPPLDENREGCDITTHVSDVCEDNNIEPLLDRLAGNWTANDINFGQSLYEIAIQCLEDKKKRPMMVEVAQSIGNLLEKCS